MAFEIKFFVTPALRSPVGEQVTRLYGQRSYAILRRVKELCEVVQTTDVIVARDLVMEAC